MFPSHCLLNENVRYAGGATRSGAVSEVVDRHVDAGVGLCQLPCPEQHAWGGVHKPYMLRLYGVRALRLRAIRQSVTWTRLVHRRLARRVARDIAGYVHAGDHVVEIVGVGASPSCGVATTIDIDGAVGAMARCDLAVIDAVTVNRDVVLANGIDGRGLFIDCRDRALRRRGASAGFVEHDLIAELADAGAVAQ